MVLLLLLVLVRLAEASMTMKSFSKLLFEWNNDDDDDDSGRRQMKKSSSWRTDL